MLGAWQLRRHQLLSFDDLRNGGCGRETVAMASNTAAYPTLDKSCQVARSSDKRLQTGVVFMPAARRQGDTTRAR
jgi:hypothetical protein